MENRFPAIWLPSSELQDLGSLLWHRHQWIRMPQANTECAAVDKFPAAEDTPITCTYISAFTAITRRFLIVRNKSR
jgi:hypothetical protein